MNNPIPPPQRLLPNGRLDKQANVDSKRTMEKLKYYQSSFSSQRKFWIEVAVLNRLEYKNKNQHRHFHRFKRSSEARRLIKRFQRLAVDKVITQLYTLFWNEAPIDQCNKKKGVASTIPTREFCEYAMQTLIASAVLLDKLQVVLVEVYREYSTLLKLKHFVSLALVHMGLSARMYTLAHKWAKEIADCYDMIQPFHLACPYGWKKGAAYACQPTTMADERQLADRWIENRLSFKNPIHFEYFLTHQNSDNPKDHSIPLDTNALIQPNDDDLGAPVGDDLGVPIADDDDLGEIITRD